MRRLIAALAILLVGAGAAAAKCAGTNLFTRLERTDPAAAEALLREARAVPNGEGRFWRIEKQGVAPSFLFGTFHVADAVDSVPNAVWPALDSARIAIFEVTLSDEGDLQRRMARDPRFVMETDAPPFAERMTAEDLALVDAAFAARGVELPVAEKLRPWMQISLISFPPCQLQDVARGAEMLDIVLARRAVEQDIPEMGLERAIDALQGLSDLSREDQTRLIVAAGRSAAFEEDLFTTNLELYHAGRIALIERFDDWIARRHMTDLDLQEVKDRLLTGLLDERNARWLPKLLPEIEEGNAFVAVGALHLVGEAGLVASLVRAGYTATRLD